MTRRSMSTTRRVRIFEAADGRCHLCGVKIGVGEAWEAEHRIALAAGGTDDDDNLAPAHIACHRSKTTDDAKLIAKVKRVRAKHIGAKAPPRATIPGSKGSRWKRKLDGTTVWRDD